MTERTIKTRWLFPTSTNNLRMIMAQGLISSPEGFSKYYQDILEEYDGFLPLFRNRVPEEALTRATSEGNHIIPCLLELELTGMSGQVKVFAQEGYVDELLDSLTIACADGIEHILIPLPLPLGCIKKVIFESKKRIADFKKDLGTRSNTILTDLKLQSTRADSTLFEVGKKDSFLFPKVKDSGSGADKSDHLPEIQSLKPDYSLVYAYGGMLSLLFYYAKNGKESHNIFEWFSRANSTFENDSKEQQIPGFIHNYFYDGIDESKPGNKIIKGIIDCCIKPADFKNSVIHFLEDNSWGKELAERKKVLADNLREYATNSSRSVSEWFENAKSDIEKLLLMLFTRDDSKSFIDYHNDKISISEYEYVFFALFFGIRDGFVKIPPMIRKYKGVQLYISYKMAEYAHKKMNSPVSFKPEKHPPTVWQLLDKGITKHTVKLLELESCVQTIMPKADFRHEKGKNIYDGYFQPKYEIVDEKYFKRVSTRKISDIDYNKIK